MASHTRPPVTSRGRSPTSPIESGSAALSSRQRIRQWASRFSSFQTCDRSRRYRLIGIGCTALPHVRAIDQSARRERFATQRTHPLAAGGSQRPGLLTIPARCRVGPGNHDRGGGKTLKDLDAYGLSHGVPTSAIRPPRSRTRFGILDGQMRRHWRKRGQHFQPPLIVHTVVHGSSVASMWIAVAKKHFPSGSNPPFQRASLSSIDPERPPLRARSTGFRGSWRTRRRTALATSLSPNTGPCRTQPPTRSSAASRASSYRP